MVERKCDIPAPDFAAIASDPDPEHHGDRCNGLPMYEQDGVGQWIARCSQGDFEVTGCETRREAGARFYGGDQPGLFGPMGTALRSQASAEALIVRLVEKVREVRAKVFELQDRMVENGDLTRVETNFLTVLTAQLNLLVEFVDPETGELR